MPGPLAGAGKGDIKRAKKLRKTTNMPGFQIAKVVKTAPGYVAASDSPGGQVKATKERQRVRRAYKQLAEVRSQSGVEGPLTAGQKTFINTLAKETGLSGKVLAAWALAEQSGSSATAREQEGNFNWLNIGYFDSGPSPEITGDRRWRNPTTAARATADFLRGKAFGASEGIRNILSYKGRSDDEQMAAIANSGWASSAYGGSLSGTYSQVQKRPLTPEMKQQKQEAVATLKEAGQPIKKVPQSSGPTQKAGPFAGARAIVRLLVNAPVRGDKEPGHASGGQHDPANPDAYAQDIPLSGANPAENEPTYDQKLLDEIASNIRRMGGKVPDLRPGMGMVETTVQGYKIQLIPDSETNSHGSGPHLHVGAEWAGAGATAGPTLSGSSAYSTSGSGTDTPTTDPRKKVRAKIQTNRKTYGALIGNPVDTSSGSSSSGSLSTKYGNPFV